MTKMGSYYCDQSGCHPRPLLPLADFGAIGNTLQTGASAAHDWIAGVADGSAVAESVIENGMLRTSVTVATQLAGARSFIPVQAILLTIIYGQRIPDPQGVEDTFLYTSAAVLNNKSAGTLEVLVNEAGSIIYHVLFRSLR